MSNKKAKKVEAVDSDIEEDHSSSGHNSDVDSDDNYVGEKEIQADFEGRNPEHCDFHGIKQLLRQLFLKKSNVDLSQLATLIIEQNFIGSVVKQCMDDGMDEDEDDEDDGSDGVFGITTIINITKKDQELNTKKCIEQLQTLLTSLAEDNATAKTKELIKNILQDQENNVGFVINERILNIPAGITTPLFASLETELQKAIKKNKPFNFKYLIWITKTYKTADSPEVLYANQEECAIVPEAIASFEVDVSDQVDYSQWDFEGGAMAPARKVLIFEGNKLSHLIGIMRQEVEQTTPAT